MIINNVVKTKNLHIKLCFFSIIAHKIKKNFKLNISLCNSFSHSRYVKYIRDKNLEKVIRYLCLKLGTLHIIVVIRSLGGPSISSKESSSATIIVRIFLKNTCVPPEEPLQNFRRKPLDLASEREQFTFSRERSSIPPLNFLPVRNYLVWPAYDWIAQFAVVIMEFQL